MTLTAVLGETKNYVINSSGASYPPFSAQSDPPFQFGTAPFFQGSGLDPYVYGYRSYTPGVVPPTFGFYYLDNNGYSILDSTSADIVTNGGAWNLGFVGNVLWFYILTTNTIMGDAEVDFASFTMPVGYNDGNISPPVTTVLLNQNYSFGLSGVVNTSFINPVILDNSIATPVRPLIAVDSGGALDYYALDGSGPSHTICFTYPGEVQIYLNISTGVNNRSIIVDQNTFETFLVDWDLGFGNNSLDDLDFDDPVLSLYLTANSYNVAFDGTYFYFGFFYDDMFNLLNPPFLLRVDAAWTVYDIWYLAAGDAGAQAWLDNFYLTGSAPSVGYSNNSADLLIIPNEDIISFGSFAEAGPPIPTGGQMGQVGQIPLVALNCQNYCIPLYKGKGAN